MKQLAYIGNWGKASPDNPLGISVYVFDNGEFIHLQTYDTDVRAGCLYFCGNKLYVADEVRSFTGEPEGGGRFLSYKILQDGLLEKTSVSKSYGVFPCYISLSLDKKYAVVANHSTDKGSILKTALVNGEYCTVTERNEPNIVLFRLNDDGSIDKPVHIINLLTADGKNNHGSMPHFVMRHPNKDVFLVVENGADKIYQFALNEQSETLTLQDNVYKAEPNSYPRYIAATKDFSYLYVNDEKRPFINVLRMHPGDGSLSLIQSIRMIPEDQPLRQERIVAPASISPSDVILDKEESHVYAACRGTNTITVFDIAADHTLVVKQIIDCGGNYPRSISFDLEEKFLICCNMDSDLMTVFELNSDGTLIKKTEYVHHAPGLIKFRNLP